MEAQQGRVGDELNKLNVPVNPRWTALELRHALTQELGARKGPSDVPKGLASVNLSKLRSEATRLGIDFTQKDTKALLLLRNVPGRYNHDTGPVQGNHDIPKNYADWTVREMEANGDNMHPDLHRFALWHQDRTKAVSQGYLFRGDRMDKFEEEAKITPPPMSETGSSASWTLDGDPRRRSVPTDSVTDSGDNQAEDRSANPHDTDRKYNQVNLPNSDGHEIEHYPRVDPHSTDIVGSIKTDSGQDKTHTQAGHDSGLRHAQRAPRFWDTPDHEIFCGGTVL